MYKIGYRKFIFLTVFLASFQPISAKEIRPYETTRLQSTAGAGVASLLVHESVVLNPAPVAFFSNSFLYTQRDWENLDREGQDRLDSYRSNTSEAHIVTDSTSALRGSFAYIRKLEDEFKRTSYSLSMSGAMSKSSAMGITYTYAMDENFGEILDPKHFLDIGYINVVNTKVSYGLVLKDAGKASQTQRRLIGGVHYNLTNILAFILDLEIDVQRSYEDYNSTKGAVQFSLVSDIFVRAGYFNSTIDNETGTTYGLSWVGPKLSFDYALKRVHLKENNPDKGLYEDDEILTSSFAISFRI
jgi:hypothetical protein